MNREAGNYLLGAAVLVGGFALGKAVVDNVVSARTEKRVGAEFEEQHYGAVGMRREPRPSTADDLVAFAAAIGGVTATLWAIPRLAQEWVK